MARRTFADYKSNVRHALGNPPEDEMNISPGTIVNDAIEHIAAMHPWEWLQTGETVLDITGGQDYVELPADFGTLIALEHSEGWARRMIPTTWTELLRMRTDTIEDWSWSYWYVINIGNVEEGEEDAGLSLPTLNLYPTPSADATDAIRLVYRRFLRRLVADTDRPQWPAYMDRPLSLLARSMASVDYDDDPDSAYTVEFTSLIQDAISRDGLSGGSFGVMQGGLYPRTVPVSPYYPERIPNPTLK
jgi:hypothetical protein